MALLFYLREHLRLSMESPGCAYCSLERLSIFKEFSLPSFSSYDDTALRASRYARGVLFEAIFPGLKHFPSPSFSSIACVLPEPEPDLSKRFSEHCTRLDSW